VWVYCDDYIRVLYIKMTVPHTHVAFARHDLVHRGTLLEVLAAIKLGGFDAPDAALLIFEIESGRAVDFDLRGSLDAVIARLAPADTPRGPGRPRLGVEGREVSLLPRHWEWLARQPNGASATLRRLVEEARKQDTTAALRARRDAVCRLMSGLAGDLPGFEEATRILYSADTAAFATQITDWPADVRAHLLWMLAAVE
jgi:hypothetical protein